MAFDGINYVAAVTHQLGASNTSDAVKGEQRVTQGVIPTDPMAASVQLPAVRFQRPIVYMPMPQGGQRQFTLLSNIMKTAHDLARTRRMTELDAVGDDAQLANVDIRMCCRRCSRQCR